MREQRLVHALVLGVVPGKRGEWTDTRGGGSSPRVPPRAHPIDTVFVDAIELRTALKGTMSPLQHQVELFSRACSNSCQLENHHEMIMT